MNYQNDLKNTVKLGYNEHGYNEISTIMNTIVWANLLSDNTIYVF